MVNLKWHPSGDCHNPCNPFVTYIVTLQWEEIQICEENYKGTKRNHLRGEKGPATYTDYIFLCSPINLSSVSRVHRERKRHPQPLLLTEKLQFMSQQREWTWPAGNALMWFLSWQHWFTLLDRLTEEFYGLSKQLAHLTNYQAEAQRRQKLCLRVAEVKPPLGNTVQNWKQRFWI